MKFGFTTRCFKTLGAYLGILAYSLKLFFTLLKGIWKISKLVHKPVTIFGGSRLSPDSIYMSKASELARMLAMKGIPVLTGGGPGIMEAATCGATHSKHAVGVITNIGITVTGLNLNEPASKCLTDAIVLDNYGARKWLLIQYSVGYAVFPGGFGTLNELTEILTLVQTKLHVKTPIVLIGIDYWKPIMEWIHDSALKQRLIAEEDVALFAITDDINEAYHILINAHPAQKKE